MKTITFCLATTLAASCGVQALAQNIDFPAGARAVGKIYGQINLTYQGMDDGTENQGDLVDNSNSTSRLGFRIDWPRQDNSFLFVFETGLGILSTGETSQTDDQPWFDWKKTDIRKFEIAYGGSFGKIWAGQGSMATDGAAEVDNSGTSVAGYVNGPDTAGSYMFRRDGELSDVTIGDTFKDFDGGRRFRLRYDTPGFSGATISVAYGIDVLNENDNNDYYDAALRYVYSDDMVGLETAVGYSWKAGDGATTEYLIASASLIHRPSGANITLAVGDDQNGNGHYWYSKLGWKGDLIDQGSTAVSVDYYDGAGFEVANSASNSWGLQAAQQFDGINLEGYLGYRQFAFEDAAAPYQDINAVLFGARWRF